MLSMLAATVLTLLAMIGPSVDFRDSGEGLRFTDIYGNVRFEPTAAGCTTGGVAVIYLPASGLTLDILAHELAHAYDCIDDGYMNGSPLARPPVRPAWISDYCWNSGAEWFACSVQRYGIHALDLRSSNADDLEVGRLALPDP
ncbi:hypothetical protein LCGC14_2215710 [marine sediment metagenome]|uniref:Uncharacterized protein n=1 Tax=marine sediment metagenome TaxID=412755 RepID=A0A0F9DCN6_9ZZZZ